jgi:hypothetical protein
MGKMKNGYTTTKSIMTSANSCHGSAAIDNGDRQMHKWWHGEQQMRQLTKEQGHCNQTHLLVINGGMAINNGQAI